mgnify:CR=1 FL=1
MQVVAAALLVLVAGCDDNSKGTPTPATTTVNDAAIWDPCDPSALPPQALEALGYDPTIANRDIAGAKFPGWKVCGWQGNPTFHLTVFSADKALTELPNNSEFRDIRPAVVPGREAVTFGLTNSPDDEFCYVAIATPFGNVSFQASPRSFTMHGLNVCGEALRGAVALEGYVPR